MGSHPSGFGPHVLLPDYIENTRKTAIQLKELDVKVVNLFTAFQQRDYWATDCFTVLWGTNDTSCYDKDISCMETWNGSQITVVKFLEVELSNFCFSSEMEFIYLLRGAK